MPLGERPDLRQLEALSEGITITVGTEVVHCNAVFARMTGYPKSQLVGMPTIELVHLDDRDRAEARIRALMEGAIPYPSEYRLVRKDGSGFVAEGFSARVTWDDTVALATTVRDITEHKKAEEALLLSEARLRESQRIAHVGTWEWEVASDTSWLSDETYQIFGLEREKFSDTLEELLSCVHPDDRQLLTETIDRAVCEGVPYSLDYRIRRGRGSERLVHERGEFIRDTDDKLYRMRGTVQDITEAKRAEEALRESEAHLRESQRIAHLGSWEYDLSTGKGSWSDENYRLHGQSKDFEPTYEGFLELVHPADRQRVMDDTAAAMAEGTPLVIDHRIVLPDGSVRLHHEKAAVEVDASGVPRRVVGICHDITERQEAENHLRRSREQLRALNTRFRSAREEEQKTLSLELHDEIGQAMTALQMDLHSLREADLDRDTVEARLDAMMALTTTVIAAGRRISTGLRPSVLDDLGLTEAVEWLASDFEERTGTACTLEVQGAESSVRGEVSTAFFRILQEALTNVIRHAEADSALIRLDLSGDPPTLEVVDDGRGATEEEIDGSTSLGVLGMRERAAAVGGTVEMGAGDDGGTVVRIAIPRWGLQSRRE